ncbi:MAG: DUF4838 domain-containing protein [Candidatus Latescibacterota bacterium]
MTAELDSTVVPGRAWCVEATMGHCVLWPTGAEPLLPGDRYDGRAYARELADLLRWGVERGINGIDVLHGERGGYADPGGLLLEEEAIRRGLPFAVGGHVGHGFPHWMPAALTTLRPELCRVDEHGKRAATGNLCTADPEALGRAVGELTLLRDRHPRARLLQVFPDDVIGGSWCHCPRCRDRSPTEQYAALVAAIAGAVDARLPGTEVGFLLYHDTLSGLPDSGQRDPSRDFLPPNVYALYAPRERCYAHAIDDETCPRNRLYWEHLLRAREVFDGRVDVFEYYGDTILWHYFNVAVPRVIAADLRAYGRLGVREVQALAFGTYSQWAHGLNLAAFALLSSGQEREVDSAVQRYAGERYGVRAADRMTEYYRALEEVQEGYLSMCAYGEDWMSDLRGMSTASPHYGAHRERALESRAGLTRLADLLADAARVCGSGEGAVHLHAEQVSLENTRAELDLLDLRLAIGERITGGGPWQWTEEERRRQSSVRQQQWDLAQGVPVEIRGQAFGALAP